MNFQLIETFSLQAITLGTNRSRHVKGHDEICLKIVNIFVLATCALGKMWPVWPMILFLFYKAFLEKTVVEVLL